MPIKRTVRACPCLLTRIIDYLKEEGLMALKEQKVTGYIPNFGLYEPNKGGFRYFPGGDY